jgi:hypothetical protein
VTTRRSVSGRAALAILAAFALAIFVVLARLASTSATFSATSENPANLASTLTVAAAADHYPPTSGAGGNVSLSWSASPTADKVSVSYHVLRRPAGGGTYAQVAGPLTGLSHIDDPNADGSYDYVIEARVSSFSAQSVARTGLSDGTPPTTATNLTATSGSLGGAITVELSWSAATDATAGVAGYTIRRAQVATALSSCPTASPSNYPSSTEVGNVTSASIPVSGTLTYHCFYLIARDSVGNVGANSAVAGPATGL